VQEHSLIVEFRTLLYSPWQVAHWVALVQVRQE
jgi:hypothetical protein